MTKTLHLPIGPPGCGKSFYAFQGVANGRYPDTAIVSPDEFREKLTDNRADQECNGHVFSIVDRIVDYRLYRGLPIYLDATNLTPKPRNELLKKAVEQDYDVQILVFKLDRDKVLEQNANRVHTVPLHAMDRMFSRLDSLDLTMWDESRNVTITEITGPYNGLFSHIRTAR